MIKFTIGRGPDNRYIINDPAKLVSTNHAIINQYPDGRITITDISSNGTTLNAAQLPKNKEINIRRGDQIVFADSATLEWSRIPVINFPSNISSVYTIGRSTENNYITKSDDTGRNHACLVVTADKAYYILDQSKNGVTISGERIPVYQFKKTNRCDKIKLGNSEYLEWSKIAGPGLSCGVKKLLIWGLPSLLILGLAGFYLNSSAEKRKNEVVVIKPQDRQSAIAMVYNEFYYTVEDKNSNVLFYYGLNNSKVTTIEELNTIDPYVMLGTGFFVSENGKFITNKHVLEPWMDEESKKYFIPGSSSWLEFVKGGISTKVGIIPNGRTVNKNNIANALIPCDIESIHTHKDVDLAIAQVRGKNLPSGSTFIPLSDVYKRDDLKNVQVLDEIVILGYPFALRMWDDKNITINPTFDNGKISSIDMPYNIKYNANTAKGASGSPVIHLKTGKIIAVNTAMLGNDHNFGTQTDYIHQLIQ